MYEWYIINSEMFPFVEDIYDELYCKILLQEV